LFLVHSYPCAPLSLSTSLSLSLLCPSVKGLLLCSFLVALRREKPESAAAAAVDALPLLLLLHLASQPSGCGVSGIVSSWNQLERVRFYCSFVSSLVFPFLLCQVFCFCMFSLLRERLGILAERETRGGEGGGGRE
jgi:hypothetical protein